MRRYNGLWVLIACGLAVLGLPRPAAAATPTATFDWSMPERLTDGNGDGILDYFSDLPTDAARLQYINPSTWKVAINACESSANEYHWKVNGVPATFTPTTSTPCLFTFNAPREDAYDVGLTVVKDGVTSAETHRRVVVQDLLVVSIGDSYGSGEGAPDRDAQYHATGSVDPPVWKDKQCHRSANAGSAVAARKLEESDPKTSVTFIHLACSGATVHSGLLGKYEGADPPDGLNPTDSNPFPCLRNPEFQGCIPPQVDEARRLMQGRELDALYIQIGGNDVHFADIVKACIAEQPCFSRPFQPIAHDSIDNLHTACDGLSTVLDTPCDDWINEIEKWASSQKTADELYKAGRNGTDPGPDGVFEGIHEVYADLHAALKTKLLNNDAWADRVIQGEYIDATTDENGNYCDESGGVSGFFNYVPFVTASESQWVDLNVERALNVIVDENHERYGWRIAGDMHRLFERHGICSKQPFVNSLADSFLNEWGYKGGVHPNKDGFAAYGEAIYSELHRTVDGPCAPAKAHGLRVLEGAFTVAGGQTRDTPESDTHQQFETFQSQLCFQETGNGVWSDAGSTFDVSGSQHDRQTSGSCVYDTTMSGKRRGAYGDADARIGIEEDTTHHTYVLSTLGVTYSMSGVTVRSGPNPCSNETVPANVNTSTHSQCPGSGATAVRTVDEPGRRVYLFDCHVTWSGTDAYFNRFIGYLIEWLTPPDNVETRLPEAAHAYNGLTPSRILDTRNGIGAPKAPVGQTKIDVSVLGVGGVPSSGVGAVVLNLAETGSAGTTQDSWVTAWPAGPPNPGTANVNYAPGKTVSNLVIVPVGTGGKISLAVGRGTTNLIGDVQGWFPTGTAYNGLSPTRILDTRNGIGAPKAPVGQTKIDVSVLGIGGIPSSGVGAVVLNLAETGGSGTTQDSWVTAWPAGLPNPGTANVNFAPGKTVSNLVIVPVGAGGKISLAVGRGTTNLIADAQGWFPTGGSYNGLIPSRILDTRNGIGAPKAPVGQTKIDVTVAGVGGVPSSGVGAVVLNLAETGSAGTTQDSWVTAWPFGSTAPTVANLNYAPGQTASNLVIVPVGADGKIRIIVGRGTTQLIADVQGWFPA